MDADQKQQTLNALLRIEPGAVLPDTIDAARAKKLLVESGSENVALPTAQQIWHRYQAQRALRANHIKNPPKNIWAKIGISAAAAALVAVAAYPYLQNVFKPTNKNVASVSTRYRDALNVYVKDAKDYRVTASGDVITIAATELTARFDFHANHETRTVVIQTPSVTYHIVGTSIVIAATSERATLHVAAGKVRVEASGATRFVGRGEHWSLEHGKESRRGESEHDRITYRALGGGRDVPLDRHHDEHAHPNDDRLHLHEKSSQKTEGHVEHEGTGQSHIEKHNAVGREILPEKAHHEHEMQQQRAERAEQRAEQRSERAAQRAERAERRVEREARRTDHHINRTEHHK